MRKLLFALGISFILIGCASLNTDDQNNNLSGSQYIPPRVEDTPLFLRLKTLVENDGYIYSHYETGEGLIVWGRNAAGVSRGVGNQNQGIVHIPGGDQNRAYSISWNQYFKSFSDMHRACYEDPVIREIKRVVDLIVRETDYDYARVHSLPEGSRWVYHSDTVYRGLSEDYSDMVTERVSQINGVEKVVKVSSRFGNHSWNEIWLSDGTVIYCDATWYDTNSYTYDELTGDYIVDHTPHFNPAMFTFDRDLFSAGRTHYGWGDALAASPRPNIAVTNNRNNPGNTGNNNNANNQNNEDSPNFSMEPVINVGVYLNGFNENVISLGFPLQLGVDFNIFGMVLSVLGEAGIGIGVQSLTAWTSPLLEWYYGGTGEFYFPGKVFGLCFGFGLIDSYSINISGIPSYPSFSSTYMRFGIIIRGNSKFTFYGQVYGSGNWGIDKWGFGVIWN